MEAAISWLAPLLLLPGVALMIVSTAARYGQVHDEAHHWHEKGEAASPLVARHLRTRAVLFRNALVCLYLTVSLLALAGVLGVITQSLGEAAVWLIITLTALGIVSLLLAALQLIRESFLSLEIIDEHLKKL
jgi:hypothetical protein